MKKGVSKKLRDKVLTELVLQYRENIKKDKNRKLVNLFPIFSNMDIPYSEFKDVIMSLENQEYLHYFPTDDSAEKIPIRGEKIPQEFIELTAPKGTSYLETKLDKMDNERRTSFKYPIIVAIIVAIIGILLSRESANLLLQIAKWFLSLFRS